MSDIDATKTVLVSLEERNRPVTFSGTKEALIKAIEVVFLDVLGESKDIYLQIKDESWGGIFVDILEQEIPDRGIIKATRVVSTTSVESQVQQTLVSTLNQ